MELKEMVERLDSINSFMRISSYNIEDIKHCYREYLILRKGLITISLIGLSDEEIEQLDLARFNILENCYFLEIEIRKYLGKDNREAINKLEELYEKNGGEFKYGE